VLNDSMPDESFTEVVPDLEDVYFSTLKKSANHRDTETQRS
jgi:hypothetical protein